MLTQTLTSSANPRLRAAIRLRDGRARRKQSRFLIDGAREIERAIECGFIPVEIYYTENHQLEIANWNSNSSLDKTSAFQLTPNLIRSLAYGDRDSDIVAVCNTPHSRLEQLQLPPAPLIVVLDAIEKPGNIGAIFRTADASGADAVVLADCFGDQFNPNAIRASSGTVFSVPAANASVVETIDFLQQHHVRIVATRVDAVQSHWDCDWNGPVALVIGNEANGIGSAWRTSDISGIKIPMAGIADSLNASITAAICLYEAARHRRDSNTTRSS